MTYSYLTTTKRLVYRSDDQYLSYCAHAHECPALKVLQY